jgi:hypothetical protein
MKSSASAIHPEDKALIFVINAGKCSGSVAMVIRSLRLRIAARTRADKGNVWQEILHGVAAPFPVQNQGHQRGCAKWYGVFWFSSTEYFIKGADTDERRYVAFDHLLNPDSCQGDGQWVRVFDNTDKGKYRFSIILSVHANKQSVSPKLEGYNDRGRAILTGLRVVAD